MMTSRENRYHKQKIRPEKDRDMEKERPERQRQYNRERKNPEPTKKVCAQIQDLNSRHHGSHCRSS